MSDRNFRARIAAAEEYLSKGASMKEALERANGEVRRVSGIPSGPGTSMTQQAAMLQQGYGQTFGNAPPADVLAAMQEQGLDTTAMFAPGGPLNPFAPWGQPPRARNFPTGYNIGVTPRSREVGRPSFDSMRALAQNYDVAELCISHLIKDISSLDWDIVPMRGEKGNVDTAIAQAHDFFAKPDGKTAFRTWQKRYLRDILTFDAGTLYKHRNRRGDLLRLRVISGATVAPTIDYFGEVPDPPAPAFVQIINGLPWEWMQANDVVYIPFNPDSESPYGRPPIENLIITANTDMRLQMFFLEFFTEGSIPDTWMVLGTDNPQQVKREQQAYDDAMKGDQTQKHGIRFLPAGSQPFPAKSISFDEKFALHIMRKTASMYGVTPNDLGFTDDVNRSTGETQVDVQYRVGVLPLVAHLSGIYDAILQEDLQLPLSFQFDTGAEEEDRLVEAQAMDLYIRNGTISPDESRSKVFGFPTDNTRPVGRFIIDRTGMIQMADVMAGQGTTIDPETFLPDASTVEERRLAKETAAAAPPPPVVAPAPQQAQPAQEGPQDGAQTDQPEDGTAENGSANQGVKRAELRRWRENARRRVRTGKAPRMFISADLDPDVIADVWRSLERATTLAQVDAVFAGVGIGQSPLARSRNDERQDLWADIHARHVTFADEQEANLRPVLVKAAREAVSAALDRLRTKGLIRADSGSSTPAVDKQALTEAITQAFEDISSTTVDDWAAVLTEAEKQAAAVGVADAQQLLAQAAAEHVQEHGVLKQTALSGLRDHSFDPGTWITQMQEGLAKQLGPKLATAAEGGANYDELLAITDDVMEGGGNAAFLELNEMLAGSVADESRSVYGDLGVEQVDLLTAPDAEQDCLDIADANPWNLGDAPDVPVHYRCRCSWAPHI